MYLNQVSLESIRIDTPEALTAEQLHSVAQFKGQLYLDLNVRQISEDPAEQIPQYKVTQQMLDILATSKAKSLVLSLPVSDHLDWSVLSQYKQTLSIYAGQEDQSGLSHLSVLTNFTCIQQSHQVC